MRTRDFKTSTVPRSSSTTQKKDKTISPSIALRTSIVCSEEESDCAEAYLSALLSSLRVEAEGGRILLVDPPVPSKERQQRLVELLFEKFLSEGIYLNNSAVLASFYCAKESALVVDIGGENTFVTPVHEGFRLRQGLAQEGFGGETVTRAFDAFLATNKPEVFDFDFLRRRNNLNTPAHELARLELAREVKESLFKVSTSQQKVLA